MSMSDSDYSDCESDDEVPPNFTHGNTKEPSLLLNDALSKLKHWKSKYTKCKKERNNFENDLKEARLKIKNLTEVKLENDKLKVDCDVEKRTFEMKLANEMEQTKKYQVLLKQAKASLEDMTEKHKEIADLNKANEAKLFQTKIEYAGIMSGAAGLEEQVTGLKDEVRSSKQMVNDQLATIHSLSSEKSMLQKDNQILNQRCKEISLQCQEFQALCEKLDSKYSALTHDHATLKNCSEANTSSLNQSVSDSRDEILQITKQRDSLSLNLSHTKETLVTTSKRLSDLESLYKKEKLAAEENNVLLKQAEISLQHLKELYTEKEGQLRKHVSDLENQISDFKQELDSTKVQLREAQHQVHSLDESLAHQQAANAELLTEKEDMACKVRDISLQIHDFTEIIHELKMEDETKTEKYNSSIAHANKKVEHLNSLLSEQAATLHVLGQENTSLTDLCDESRRLSVQVTDSNVRLEKEISHLKAQQVNTMEELNNSTNHCDVLESEKVRWTEVEREYSEKLSNLERELEERKHLVNVLSEEKSQSHDRIEEVIRSHKVETESLNNNLMELTTSKRDLESQVFEQKKNVEFMKNRHLLNQNLIQKKIDLMESRVSDQALKISDLTSENSNILVKLERHKAHSEHYDATVAQLTQVADTERAKHEGVYEELNKSLNKNEDSETKMKLVNEALENEKIKWSGKECRYVSEIRGLQQENKDLKGKVKDITSHYTTEVSSLTNTHVTLHASAREEHEKEISALKCSLSTQEDDLMSYQNLINHTITTIHTSLSHIMPLNTSCHLSPCARSPYKQSPAQRGGQTLNTDKSDQIAALNTELGQLTATSEHLRDRIKQLEEEKQHETERFERLNEEKSVLIAAKNDIEIEMGKQRDVFKEEIRNMKNDMKNNENKHEVLKKKLEGSREELAKMEHELRSMQNSLADKTNTNEKFTEEIGSLKADNNVLSHQHNELKSSCQERLGQIENLKTRITVIQEDNKNLRGKSEDSLAKVKEKETSFKEVQDKLYEANQQLHSEQIKYIEEIGLVKEEFQERIYGLESEIKQAKYERESKETQIVALREQINKRVNEKVSHEFSPVTPISSGLTEEAATQYRELFEKYSAVQTDNQTLRSEKIILDNNGTQLRVSLETEKEKLVATEQAVKTTTDMLNDSKIKLGKVENQYNKAINDITRLEELLKVEKDRYMRLTCDYETEKGNTSQTNISMAALKDQLGQCKEDIKQLTTEKQILEQALGEKERMLSSEAKLRLHISSQLSSNSSFETAIENERRKVEKLEDKCLALSDQIEKLKRSLEDTEASRKKLREELEENNKPVLSVTQYEDKIRALKAKLATEKETAKKAHEVLTKKVREAQGVVKEELAQRKEHTEKYIGVKSEIGELQGKVTVLLAENERLKSHCDAILKEKNSLAEDKSELQSRIATDYIQRSEVEMSRKNLEAKNRVELNRKLHEMNQKLDYDNKSRETIDKFKAATETKFREDLEKANRMLKEKVNGCQEMIERQNRQVTSLQLESEKLKQILSEERRSVEKLLPSFVNADHIVPPLPLPASPRSPLNKICDNANTSYRSVHDANNTWQLMKCKLNESLNKYLVEEPLPVQVVAPGHMTPGRVTPGHMTPGHMTPGRVTPGGGNGGRSTPINQGSFLSQQHLEPDPVRTSADSFL